jgi:succinate dehydrogenase / fumarate reductase iron-sulfur subunit
VQISPLPHMPVVKDLIPDLTLFYAQYASIEPWLHTDTPEPQTEWRSRRKIARSSTASTSASSAPAARPRARATGGTATVILGPAALLHAYRWLIDSRDEATGERLDALGGPLQALSLPHDHELRPGLPEGAEPGQGHRRDQEDDGRARRLTGTRFFAFGKRRPRLGFGRRFSVYLSASIKALANR